MIGIQMPHHPSLAGLDRQKRNQLAQRWVIHVHLTVQFLSQSLIQFIAHPVYESRVQKAQLGGIKVTLPGYLAYRVYPPRPLGTSPVAVLPCQSPRMCRG